MTDGKDLLVRVDAETTGYERAIARAEAQTHSFEYALRRANAQAAENERRTLAQTRATEMLGRGMLVAGGVIALGLGLAAKAAMDWESQWTSVLKVLDGTPEQLAAVEKGIRGLALEMPTSHGELAEIAASAGALGIQTPNIVEFTRVIAMLGETTNLVGDEGATTLARFANIMGTSQGEIDNVAAAIVALGNSGASTESEIAELALRLAAAGKNAGLSEGEVLGLASAMKDVGIEAESGGSAISLTFQMIDKAVKGGGASLQGFAEIAGLSGDKFVELYGNDAAAAFTKFLDGLGQIKAEGGNVYQVLEDLGITGLRQIDTLTRLAGASDGVAKALKTGVVEYERNMALTDEFAKRNATTAAELERARNAAVDLSISLGETLLPVVGQVAETLGTMLRVLGAFPEPVKDVATTAAAALAALLLLGGGALYVSGKVKTLSQSWADLQNNGQGMTRGFLAQRAAAGALGIGLLALNSTVSESNTEMKGLLNVASGAALGFAAGGPWGAALGGAVGLLGTFAQKHASAKEEVAALTDTLDEQTGTVTANTRAWVAQKLIDAGIGESAKRLGLDLDTVTRAVLDQADALKAVNEATAVIPTTYQPAARGPGAGVSGLPEEASNANAVAEAVDSIRDALQGAREEWRLQQEVAEIAGDEAIAAMDGTKVSAYDAQVAVDALTESFSSLDKFLSQRAAERELEAAEDALRKQIRTLKDHEKVVGDNTEAGRENEAMLDDYADKIKAATLATLEETQSREEGRRVLEAGRQKIYDFAIALGASKKEASELAGELRQVEREWKPNVDLDTSAARIAAASLKAYIEAMDPTVTVGVQYQPQTYGRRAGGGLIVGPGGPRDDAAGLYALSNKEYVHQAAAVDYYGVGFMDAINQRLIPRGRMADGGTPGGGGGGGQALLSLARLMQMLSRPEDTTTLREVNDLIQARNREERQLTEALKEQAKARRALKDAHGDKQKEEAAKAVERAEKAVTDQRTELADATNKWREAQSALLEQTKAYALTVSSLGDAFGGEGTSTTIQGLIAKKQSARDAGKEFDIYLRTMRRKNVDEDLIREIRAEGPTSAGLALAESIAESARRQIQKLNRSDNELDRAARNVGTFGIGGRSSHDGIGTQINNNFNGPVHGDPHKFARAAEKRQRKAQLVARRR